VVVDRNAVAFATQRASPLVYAHRPAVLRQRHCGDQSAKTGADDLGMSRLHSIAPCERDRAVSICKKKAASGGELPEAAVAAVRLRMRAAGELSNFTQQILGRH